MTVKTKIMPMQCGCRVEATFRIGDDKASLLCIMHGNMEHHVLHGMNATCQDCDWQKDYGFAPITAETKAVRHSTAHGHRVLVWRDDLQVRKKIKKKESETVALF